MKKRIRRVMALKPVESLKFFSFRSFMAAVGGLLAACQLLSACQTDSYETGTGAYSLTRADFVEAHANAAKAIDYVLTDDGDSLVLTKLHEAKWVQTPDTAYRAVLYYNQVDDNRVDLVTIGQVYSLPPRAVWKYKEQKTDPVKFESAWKSRSGRYVNLGLYFMVGYVDEEVEGQTIGMMCDTIMTETDGSRTAHLRLYHDQGDIPQYFSNKTYISIPVDSVAADSAVVSVATYDGTVERSFRLR